MSTQEKIRIVGGGFSGLIQAFYLIEAGYKVEVIEKESRLGGLVGSLKEGEFLVEQAANAFIANKELEKVASTIGVKLVPIKKSAKKRFIYRNGEMCRWPLSFSESLPLISFLISRKFQKQKVSPKPNETLQDWGKRCLGKEATFQLLEPGMRGIFIAPAKNLDASMVLNSLTRRYPRGDLKGSVAPLGGMQEWIDKMSSYLLKKGCDFKVGQETVDFNDSIPTILAVGLSDLRTLVNQQKIRLDKKILETQSASLTSVTLCFAENKAKSFEGFGCLFPKNENFNSSGVLFNHNVFPGRAKNGVSETWILSDNDMAFSQMSHSALLRYILSDRFQFSGENIKPDFVKISQWSEKIPIYDSKLSEFLENFKEEGFPFLFAGNYLGDLGLSKLLFRAKSNAEKVKGGYFA